MIRDVAWEVRDRPLSKRERQVMDILYRLGTASAGDIYALLPDPPTYNAVRSVLRVLETKGLVQQNRAGRRLIYHPATPRDDLAASRLQDVILMFYHGSPFLAIEAIIANSPRQLRSIEIQRLQALLARSAGFTASQRFPL